MNESRTFHYGAKVPGAPSSKLYSDAISFLREGDIPMAQGDVIFDGELLRFRSLAPISLVSAALNGLAGMEQGPFEAYFSKSRPNVIPVFDLDHPTPSV